MSDRAALTVDLELFAHTPAYRAASGTTDREGVGLEGVAFLRRTLARHGAGATWFVVGEVAEAHPDAVASLAEAGHEIGSHTVTHRLLTDLDGATRREELERSREVLTSVAGPPVDGFRAPAFAVTDDHFRLVDAAGYGYDASVVPSRRIPGWYGGEFALRRPAPATAVDAGAPPDLLEVPAAVMPWLGLPLSGAWLRAFGPRYTITGMRLLARRGVPPVLYVHPWEFVDLPDVAGVPRRVTVRTGAWMRRAVERVLATGFEFVPVRTLLEDRDVGPDPAPGHPRGTDRSA